MIVVLLVFPRHTVADQTTLHLFIQRTGGLQFSSTVQYSTRNSSAPISVGTISFVPASRDVHFLPISAAASTFDMNQVSRWTLHMRVLLSTFFFQNLNQIAITVYPLAVNDIPRAFYVDLTASGSE